MPERDLDPTVYRRRLRTILREMRESQNITQGAAADEMSWSMSKLIRIESGSVTISVNDLKALVRYYGVVDQDRVNALVEMARNSRKHSWLTPYRGVAGDVFLTFLAHEDAAARSYSFQPILVPGLLQTEEYAAEVLRVIRGPKDLEYIERQVELRVARQEKVFSRTDKLDLHYLLDESVVRRAVGGQGVMKRQVSHLLESCQLDNVSLRIVPFNLGIYRSIRVPYVVLEFNDPENETILYLEYPQGESIVREDGPVDVDTTGATPDAPTAPPTYLEIFAELEQRTSDEETTQILENTLREFDS